MEQRKIWAMRIVFIGHWVFHPEHLSNLVQITQTKNTTDKQNPESCKKVPPSPPKSEEQ